MRISVRAKLCDDSDISLAFADEASQSRHATDRLLSLVEPKTESRP